MRGTCNVDHTVKVRLHHGLKSVGTQLLERCNVAVSGIIHHNIESLKCLHSHLHGCICRALIRHIKRRRPNLFAISLHQIVKTARIAGGGNETIPGCQYSFCNIAT
jgi:hypothetical protein